jgi:hypothetical protein
MTQPVTTTDHASPGHAQLAEVERMKAIVQDRYGDVDAWTSGTSTNRSRRPTRCWSGYMRPACIGATGMS